MMTEHIGNSLGPQPPGWMSVPNLRYPYEHLAFVAVSSLDVILTWLILALGGSEVNPIAALVIHEWGLTGAILFKYSLTLFVVIVCEVVGRTKERTGRALAGVAIAISSLPVLYSLGLLAMHWMQEPM